VLITAKFGGGMGASPTQIKILELLQCYTRVLNFERFYRAACNADAVL